MAGTQVTLNTRIDDFDREYPVFDKMSGEQACVAAFYGLMDKVEAYLNAGGNIEHKHDGETLLHWACRWRDSRDLIAMLLTRGADRYATDRDGYTATLPRGM